MLTTGNEMDVDFPIFDPTKFELSFPFFEKKDRDNHIDLFGRDDVLVKINRIMHDRLNKDKYWPVIISTSRGMGKTFLLKKFGMQQNRNDLKNPLIGNAIITGRILSFDFAKYPTAIQNNDDVFSFFSRLMIFFFVIYLMELKWKESTSKKSHLIEYHLTPGSSQNSTTGSYSLEILVCIK